MLEQELNPTSRDERDEVAYLKARLAKAESAASEAEAFGKFAVVAPKLGEDTFESYLDKRPENGIIRDGETFRENKSGQFASAEQYRSDKTPQSTADYYHNLMESGSKPYEEKDFKSLGLKQLVFEMARAEKLGDKALSLEVQDAMGTRLTELADKEGWTSNQKDEQADILLSQVIKLSGHGEHKTEPAKDAKVESKTIPRPGEAVLGIPPLGNGANLEPALDGESQDEYEARNKIAKIDVVDDVILSPIPRTQDSGVDTLGGVVLSPVPGEQMPGANPVIEDSEKVNVPKVTEADKLDEEKQSIWNKVKGRTKNLYLKAGTLFSTTLFTAGNFMPTPKQKSEETKDQFEARVKRYGTAKILGVVALIIAAKYGLPLLHGGESSSGAPSGSSGSGAGAGGGSELDPSAFSAEAHTVTRGEGWYQTLKEMKITNATEQANLLHKVGPELQARGWAYPMKNGSWGISHTGQLPDDVLKLIKNSR